MSKINKITMGTIIVIILVGFIDNSMSPFNAGLTVLGSYIIIHGGMSTLNWTKIIRPVV